jgi:hypothetical protein
VAGVPGGIVSANRTLNELGMFLYEQASLILGLRKDFFAVAVGEQNSSLGALNIGATGQSQSARAFEEMVIALVGQSVPDVYAATEKSRGGISRRI